MLLKKGRCESENKDENNITNNVHIVHIHNSLFQKYIQTSWKSWK